MTSWVIDYCYPNGEVYLSCHGQSQVEAERCLAAGSSNPENLVRIYEETYDD